MARSDHKYESDGSLFDGLSQERINRLKALKFKGRRMVTDDGYVAAEAFTRGDSENEEGRADDRRRSLTPLYVPSDTDRRRS